MATSSGHLEGLGETLIPAINRLQDIFSQVDKFLECLSLLSDAVVLCRHSLIALQRSALALARANSLWFMSAGLRFRRHISRRQHM